MIRYVLYVNGNFCGYFESTEKAEHMLELIKRDTNVKFYDIYKKGE